MSYTKGHMFYLHPDRVPDNMVYYLGMKGTDRQPRFKSLWDNTHNSIRGIVHQPIIGNTEDTNAIYNADEFYALLSELGKNNWDVYGKVVIDPWLSTKVYNDLDNLLEYAQKLWEKTKPTNKFILRYTPKQWGDFFAKVPDRTMKLLDYFDLLMVEPGKQIPSFYRTLSGNEIPTWFEYQYGLVAYDPTMLWKEPLNQPAEPPAPIETPEPEPKPIEEPETPPAPQPTTPKVYDVELSWGFIKLRGTITERGE